MIDPCGVAIADRRGPASWSVECSCCWASTGHPSDTAALAAHAAHAGTTYEAPRVSAQHRGGTR